jgi:hypothetical protein
MIFETAIYALNAFRFRVGGATSFRPFPSASPAPASPPYRQLKLGRGPGTAGVPLAVSARNYLKLLKQAGARTDSRVEVPSLTYAWGSCEKLR